MPPTMSTAPAQPIHDTDQENLWSRGTVWSLARKATTDWWKTTRDRSTRMPVEETVEADQYVLIFPINKMIIVGQDDLKY